MYELIIFGAGIFVGYVLLNKNRRDSFLKSLQCDPRCGEPQHPDHSRRTGPSNQKED